METINLYRRIAAKTIFHPVVGWVIGLVFRTRFHQDVLANSNFIVHIRQLILQPKQGYSGVSMNSVKQSLFLNI